MWDTKQDLRRRRDFPDSYTADSRFRGFQIWRNSITKDRAISEEMPSSWQICRGVPGLAVGSEEPGDIHLS